MNSKERFLTALRGGTPDRLPVFERFVSKPVVEAVIGRSTAYCAPPYRSAQVMKTLAKAGKERDQYLESMIDDQIEMVRRLGYDAILVHPIAPRGCDYDIYIENTAWRFGSAPERVATYKDAEDGMRWNVDYLLERLEDIDRWEPFNQDAPGAMDYINMVLDRVGNDLAVIGCADGSYPNYIDDATWLMGFYDAPDLIRKCIEKATRNALDFGKAQIDAGVDVIYMGRYYAGKNGPFVSPLMFKEFILPSLTEQVASFKGWGALTMKYIGGMIWKILPDILRTGVDSVQGLDISAGVTPHSFKEAAGGEVCVCGSIDCGDTLCNRLPEDVKAEVRSCIRALVGRGGHIMCSSDTLEASTKLENLYAMLDATREYGKYPMEVTQ
jgi:uroporphyrinogen decarboxylase